MFCGCSTTINSNYNYKLIKSMTFFFFLKIHCNRWQIAVLKEEYNTSGCAVIGKSLTLAWYFAVKKNDRLSQNFIMFIQICNVPTSSE